MARDYKKTDIAAMREEERKQSINNSLLAALGALGFAASPLMTGMDPMLFFGLGALPALAFGKTAKTVTSQFALEKERQNEVLKRGGKAVLGMPPERDCFNDVLNSARSRGKNMIDKYLVGFELETGAPLWLDEDDICTHGCVFAKTGVGKTLWLESLIFQQMARGRASGCTFIDAKRDSGTLAHIILMALLTGRIEDLIVIDPFDPVHSYNFVLTNQRADVKARKVLRAGLPPTSDQSTTKHYDRLAADSIYRMVRAMESFGLAWSMRDIAVALSAFNIAYPHLRSMLHKIGARQAMVELGHLASSYRNPKGVLDTARITDNLRGIASELHAIAGSDTGHIFCTTYSDLVLTDAILRGKIIYFMLPRLEEAESAARMVKVFREDLEVSIGEITSSRQHNLEDPHLVIIDEGSSTFGPTWANLFELARKGRFALLFGAQSTGGLTDEAIGLSEAFYERVMANVNLKVMMRIGDNRTATDMTEWIGKVTTTKKSVGTGITSGKMGHVMAAGLDLQTGKKTSNESKTISFSEDETDLVSSEELKHEMSAEKGLAWFDMGNGKIVKGRSFWFNSELPDTWEGREFLSRLEKFENDELGLADWVDEQILSQEQQETASVIMAKPKIVPGGAPESTGVSATKKGDKPDANGAPPTAEESGPFKINMMNKGFRPRSSVVSFSKPQDNKGSSENGIKKAANDSHKTKAK
jgi:TraM recognition site of TraD and TraG